MKFAKRLLARNALHPFRLRHRARHECFCLRAKTSPSPFLQTRLTAKKLHNPLIQIGNRPDASFDIRW